AFANWVSPRRVLLGRRNWSGARHIGRVAAQIVAVARRSLNHKLMNCKPSPNQASRARWQAHSIDRNGFFVGLGNWRHLGGSMLIPGEGQPRWRARTRSTG